MEKLSSDVTYINLQLPGKLILLKCEVALIPVCLGNIKRIKCKAECVHLMFYI
jgi:hypothetical protein